MTDRLTKSAVENLSQELGEPGWLAERRLVAFDVFEKLAAKGVVVADFITAAADHPDLLKEHFFTEVPVDEHKFTALHAAFHSDGVLVYVPRNVEVELPLEVARSVTA